MIRGRKVADLRHPLLGARRLGRAALLLAAVLACACARGPVHVPAAAPDGVVPWIDTPGKAMSLAQPSAAARPCNAADLEVTVKNTGVYHGHGVQRIELMNRAQDACYLPGPPALQLRAATGNQPVDSPGDIAAKRVDLQPGEFANLGIGAPLSCPGTGPAQSQVVTQLTLTPAGGGSISVQGVHLEVGCGPAQVDLFLPPQPPPLPRVAMSDLTAKYGGPQALTHGQPLRYTIILANPTNHSIPLSPCPSYTQLLSSDVHGTITSLPPDTRLLNCDAALQVPPMGSVTFEMRLAVPGNLPPGAGKLLWKMEIPSGPAAGTGVSVQ